MTALIAARISLRDTVPTRFVVMIVLSFGVMVRKVYLGER
jgi:hypothetical protein